MNITLKSLKVCEWNSEETTCFTATMYVDGQRVCKVSNEGHGGPNMYMPVYNESLLKKAQDFVGAIPCKGYSFNHDLDTWLGDVMEKMEEEKQLKRWCRTKIVARTKDGKKGSYLVWKGQFTPQAKEILLKKNPDIVEFVNERFL